MLFPYSGRGGWLDPSREGGGLQEEMDRAVGGYRLGTSREFPPINLWTGEEGVVVTAEVPGMDPEDIDITVHQNTLTLKGSRELGETDKDIVFHRRERNYGSTGRTVVLPFTVDPDKVEARFDDGILTVHLPRPEADKPKRILISRS